MKYLFILAFYFSVYQLSYSQCGGTIVLGSQVDVDNFAVNYPNCTNLTAGLHISGPDITNLNGLNVLTAVSGNQLLIQNNPLLTSIDGLTNCNLIVELLIFNNQLLENIDIFGESNVIINGNISIDGNPSLTSLPSFNNYNPTIPESVLYMSLCKILCLRKIKFDFTGRLVK